MIPTPRDVVPLLENVISPLYEAFREGIAWADSLQPAEDRDPFFWSHSARFRARNRLRDADATDWVLVPKVNNFGIHLLVADLHLIRVLRSLEGSTPPPGPNRRRRNAWQQLPAIQGQLALGSDGDLPPLSLVADWQTGLDEPIIHLGLPQEPFGFRQNARLHWRVPLPSDGLDLASLAFEPGPDPGTAPVTLKVDPAEEI